MKCHLLKTRPLFISNGGRPSYPDEFLVKIGTHDTKHSNIDVLVKKIHLNGFNNNDFHNDIAILELKEKVVLVKQFTLIN